MSFNNRFLFKLSESSRNILIISFLFTVANLFLFKWHVDLTLHATLNKCFTTFILNYLFWSICSINSVLIKFVLILLSTSSIILIYFCFFYDVSPLVNSVRLFLQTDLNEITELINTTIITPFVLIVIIGIIVLKSQLQAKWYYSLSAFALFVSLIIVVDKYDSKKGMIGTHGATLEEFMSRLPFNLFIDWAWELKRNIKSTKITDLSQHQSFNWDTNINDLLIILVIGESARYDKFHINGYPLHTSPHLEKQENLISLKNYYALETSTIEAIPYLFKRSNQREFIDKNESGFVSILKHLGFKTYYLSMQTDVKTELYQIAIEHDYYVLGTKMRLIKNKSSFYDEDLLASLNEIIQKPKNQLIVLHTMGSHYRYRDRVPDDFYSNQFSDYDNTIRYTDFILNSVIQMSKHRNALVIYSSDHGESLSGDKRRLHSYPYKLALIDAPEQLHIPGFWFFSKRFLETENNRVKYNNFLARSKRNADQSYIFHSVLGCIGVQSKAIQSEKNLCANPIFHASM